MREYLQSVIAEYLARFEAEADTLAGLCDLVQRSQQVDPTAHTNFESHVTGSIFVMTLGGKVLLLYHKRLGKWLQPGGHVDSTDATPFEAAIRELEEETGLLNSVLYHRSIAANDRTVPFHVDIQLIPASVSRGEPVHNHYDFQYLAMVGDESEVTIDTTESNGSEWVTWDEFKALPIFSKQVSKIETLVGQTSNA